MNAIAKKQKTLRKLIFLNVFCFFAGITILATVVCIFYSSMVIGCVLLRLHFSTHIISTWAVAAGDRNIEQAQIHA